MRQMHPVSESYRLLRVHQINIEKLFERIRNGRAGRCVLARGHISRFLLFLSKREVQCCSLMRVHGHGLFLCSERGRPSLHRVSSWRNVLDVEGPAWPRHVIHRAGNNTDVRLHPRMLIAFLRDHDLRMLEFLVKGRGSRRLRFIPSRIVFAHGIDIVGCKVAVQNLQRLPHHDPQNVRDEDTSLLIQGDWRRGGAWVESLRARFREYEDVRKGAIWIDRTILLINNSSLVLTDTLRVLVHVNFSEMWLGSFKKNPAGNFARGFLGRRRGSNNPRSYNQDCETNRGQNDDPNALFNVHSPDNPRKIFE